MINKINFSNLINSVSYWLCFQEKIGRKFMINESSLKYPIADFFTNKHFLIENIDLEFTHPLLKKRSIDIVIKENKKLSIVFEMKIASYSTTLLKEKKRIFNDLMRLYLLSNSSVETYFLISGSYEDFIAFFRSIENRKELRADVDLNDDVKSPSGFYTKWFSFKKESEMIINIKDEVDSEYRKVYENFFKEYDFKKSITLSKSLPEKIITQCIDISPLSKDSPLPYLTGIWKICNPDNPDL